MGQREMPSDVCECPRPTLAQVAREPQAILGVGILGGADVILQAPVQGAVRVETEAGAGIERARLVVQFAEKHAGHWLRGTQVPAAVCHAARNRLELAEVALADDAEERSHLSVCPPATGSRDRGTTPPSRALLRQN